MNPPTPRPIIQESIKDIKGFQFFNVKYYVFIYRILFNDTFYVRSYDVESWNSSE
jgi:hypothetical protein